jgi:hypothetical protein
MARVLLAEEFDALTGCMLGNFPQAYRFSGRLVLVSSTILFGQAFFCSPEYASGGTL